MIDKRILNIVQNNPKILVDEDLIQDIFRNIFMGHFASKDIFQNYFNEIYKDKLLNSDKAKEKIRTHLLSKLDSREKSLVNDINEIILELSKQGIFKKIFDLNFVVLNNAQGIITNILEKNNEFYLNDLTSILDVEIMKKWALFSSTAIINYINSYKSDIISYIQERLENKYLGIIFSNYVIEDSLPFPLLEKIDKNETRKLAEFLLSVIYNNNNKTQIIEERMEERQKNTAPNLDKLNLEIGESIILNGIMFHNITFDKSIPIIYVNGNVIADFTTPTNGNNRVHHSVLFKQYCEDYSLHKNDQIKKTQEEWENLTKDLEPDTIKLHQIMNDYKCVRAIQPTNGKAVAIIISFDNTKEAAKAFQAQLPNCGNVFAFDESMTFLERKARLNRLMKKVK